MEIQRLISERIDCELLNPFLNKGHVPCKERIKRDDFRTKEAKAKVDQIIVEVGKEIGLTIRPIDAGN